MFDHDERPFPIGTKALLSLPRPSLIFSLAALPVLVAIGAKLYTGHVWEDFLITFRHSENLVAGNGLVYQIGERTHGFTSPLNVLLPAVFKALFPGEGYAAGLWGFTLVSLAVWWLGLSTYLRFTLPATNRAMRIGVFVFLGCMALNVRLSIFAIAGQESGLWAGFLLLAFVALQRENGPDWKWLGASGAGLMWTRPDSCVHLAILVVVSFLFPIGSRAALVRAWLKSAALITLLYLPWFAWAWWYYGSPIPHTIIAKMNSPGTPLGAASAILGGGRLALEAFGGAFLPIYAEVGGWPTWLLWTAGAIGIITAGSWTLCRGDRTGRFASIAFSGSALYLFAVGRSGFVYPWYFVPCAVFGAIALSRMITVNLQEPSLARNSFALALGGLLTITLAYETAHTWPEMLLRQILVEDGVRKPIGLWLRAHQQPNETAMMEPIGYIGYYAGTHILDYPGLATPRVVQARKSLRAGMAGAIVELKPDWLVLRPNEVKGFMAIPVIGLSYELASVFDARAEVYRYHELPGYGFLSSDSCFEVYRRKTPPASHP